MDNTHFELNTQSPDWQRVDARILGQIFAAQNILFVLPDEARIAEFYSQALSNVPGITSCSVCLANLPIPVGPLHNVCTECAAFRKTDNTLQSMPENFSCGLAANPEMRIIAIRTNEHTFGFFIFQTDASAAFEPYWSFLSNLANYVALSLENRMHKRLLERSRDEMEQRVKERTEELKREMVERRKTQVELEQLNVTLEHRVQDRTTELEQKNAELYKMNRLFVNRELKMVELKERIRELEKNTSIKEIP